MESGVPITSAPAGGMNFTSASATGAIAFADAEVEPTVWPSLSLSTMRLRSALANASRASRKSASASLGVTSTQSNPSLRPAGFTVNNSRMLPSPDSRLAGVAVSALVRRLHRNLLEIAIVEPEILAVGDHELRRGARGAAVGRDLPAEPPGTHDDQLAGGLLHLRAPCRR